MIAQSLVTMSGDLKLGQKSPRAVRWLVNFTCSFDESKCKTAILWVDQIDHAGTYRKINQLMPDFDEKGPTVTHGTHVVTIQGLHETWTIDAVTHKVSYVHSLTKTRAEGQCPDRAPPMFEGIGFELPPTAD